MTKPNNRAVKNTNEKLHLFSWQCLEDGEKINFILLFQDQNDSDVKMSCRSIQCRYQSVHLNLSFSREFYSHVEGSRLIFFTLILLGNYVILKRIQNYLRKMKSSKIIMKTFRKLIIKWFLLILFEKHLLIHSMYLLSFLPTTTHSVHILLNSAIITFNNPLN